MLDIVECFLSFKKILHYLICLVNSFILLLWLPTLYSLPPGWSPCHLIITVASSPVL